MDYAEFVNAVVIKDARNRFEGLKYPPAVVLDNIPEQLRGFFQKFNPIDVEIVLKDLTAVKLYPLDDLKQLQNEYSLGNGRFVFATREGDPIALEENKVVTCTHGSRDLKFEVLANSFDEYLLKIMQEL